MLIVHLQLYSSTNRFKLQDNIFQLFQEQQLIELVHWEV